VPFSACVSCGNDDDVTCKVQTLEEIMDYSSCLICLRWRKMMMVVVVVVVVVVVEKMYDQQNFSIGEHQHCTEMHQEV